MLGAGVGTGLRPFLKRAATQNGLPGAAPDRSMAGSQDSPCVDTAAVAGGRRSVLLGCGCQSPG